jgi:hypothetical protein
VKNELWNGVKQVNNSKSGNEEGEDAVKSFDLTILYLETIGYIVYLSAERNVRTLMLPPLK